MRRLVDPVSLLKTVCSTITVFITVYLLYDWAQTFERWAYPVVGKLEITRMTKMDDDRTRVWVRFEKKRECRPIEVLWYRGKRDGLFERALFYVERPVGGSDYKNRPIGMQKAGPWVVSIPMEVITTQAFADAQHSCNPFWDTVSRFYN